MGLRHYKSQDISNGLVGDSVKVLIDDEVNLLLNESYKRAMAILKTHRKELDLLADALLKYETLDAEEVKKVIEGKAIRTKLGKITSANIVDTSKGKTTPSPLVGPDTLSC